MASGEAIGGLARIRALADRGMKLCDAMQRCDFVSDDQRFRIAKDRGFFWAIDFVAELAEQTSLADPDETVLKLVKQIELWEARGGCNWAQLGAPEGRPN